MNYDNFANGVHHHSLIPLATASSLHFRYISISSVFNSDPSRFHQFSSQIHLGSSISSQIHLDFVSFHLGFVIFVIFVRNSSREWFGFDLRDLGWFLFFLIDFDLGWVLVLVFRLCTSSI